MEPSLSPLSWLESRMLFGMKAGLENIATICERLGNPQNSLRTIHVVGTNGKGSTSFWLMRILEAHGLRVGLFTSPHLVSMRERIRMGNIPISAADLDRLIDMVRHASEDREVTFFEVLTAVAFLWFAEQKTDVVVLEAGLGGRLDSTNLVRSEICVLTSIGFDHTEILGDTLPQILAEKIGVWKSGALLLHNLQDDALLQIVAERADALPAKSISVAVDETIVLPQPGTVYQENASLALAAARAYLQNQMQDSLARSALASSVWAGRQQELHHSQTGALEWILDGAHNGHAAERLAETLRLQYPGQTFPLVLAILKTKFPEEILSPLLPFASEIILTRTSHPKMREPEDLYKAFKPVVGATPVRCIHDLKTALEEAAKGQKTVLCTGSLYFVGAVVENLKAKYSELAWFRQFKPDDNERK